MRKFFCLLLAVLLLISASSCQNSEPEHPVQINPTGGSENRKESYVSLYFGIDIRIAHEKCGIYGYL